MTQSDSSLKYSPWISLGGPTRALGQLAELPARVPDPLCAGSEAPRSGPWRRFRGSAGSMSSTGSIICVPFCAFLMKKRNRNHFRPPQDDPKAAASQSTSLEAVWHDPVGKRGSAQPLVVAFPGLHRLHQLHNLCSILRIFDKKKESKSFSSVPR